MLKPPAVALSLDATDRVRRRLRELSTQRRFKQTKIGQRLGIDQSSVNRYVNGTTPITVSFLEAVAEETSIPLGELVAPPGTMYQLNADEAALIRWLRKWPTSVTQKLCALIQFFAEEPPGHPLLREIDELLRGMPERDRRAIYGFALMRKEGAVPPELTASLFQQLSDESKAAVETAKLLKRRVP